MCFTSRSIYTNEDIEVILSQYGINLSDYLELSSNVFPEYTCTIENKNNNDN